MKSYRTRIARPGQEVSITEKSIFQMSDQVSSVYSDMLIEMLREHKEGAFSTWALAVGSDGNDYFDLLAKAKAHYKTVLEADEKILATLRDYFYVDGAIKLSRDDLIEIGGVLSPLATGCDETMLAASDKQYYDYAKSLIHCFAYAKSSGMVFRSPEYYFAFDSVSIGLQGRNTSINDLQINRFDFEDFCSDLLRHYSLINQNIGLLDEYFFSDFKQSIESNKKNFCREILWAIAPKKIKKIREEMASGKHTLGHADTDRFFMDQWEISIERLDDLRELINHYKVHGTPNMLEHISEFMAKESLMIRFAKATLGLDLDVAFNKFITVRPPRSIRKFLLGLLDAKINIFAFLQNISQIMCNKHFLDPEHSGNLVFSRDVVRAIKSKCPAKFKEFKGAQSTIRLGGESVTLFAELDDKVGLYVDILLNDNKISYTRLVGQLWTSDPESGDAGLQAINGPLGLMKIFFELLQEYEKACEQRESSQEKKKNAKGRPYTKSTTHLHAKKAALSKLIRIYREENDPLVMIKTAQNAINILIRKGFDQVSDVLHVMSVNYGGTLVGHFAKHTFARTIIKGQVVANAGSVVYSIYDVKNANSFSELSDYPYAKILKDATVGEGVRQKLESENWLLVFDDNTNSGETLDNLRNLAAESRFYGRVDVFPCRASASVARYKASLSDLQKLEMIGGSAVASRKTKVNAESTRYKELLGTIAGANLFKILRRAERLDSEGRCQI